MSSQLINDRSGLGPVSAGWSIDDVIDEQAVRTVFQPVVHLASGSVVGFEALSRGPLGSEFEAPLAMIAAATKADRLGELDWVCRSAAMQSAVDADLEPALSWLINMEPAGLAIACPPQLRGALEQARRRLRVVLEVVERGVGAHAAELLHATDQARRDSWGVALDDVGVQESSLALLPFLRPDVVKLDMSLIRGVPRDRAASITAAVRAYAERTGAVILAEGIETERHERLAKVFGATFGQGFRFGHPGPLPATVAPPRQVIPLGQRLAPLTAQTPYEVLAAGFPAQCAPKDDLVHIADHLQRTSAGSEEASVLLACLPDKQSFAASRRTLQDLVLSNALTVVIASDLDLCDGPGFHFGPLARGSRLAREWTVIVINPHYAAAFAARDCGDTGADGRRRYDYIYTHDRDAVIASGRSFFQDAVPQSLHLTAGARKKHAMQ